MTDAIETFYRLAAGQVVFGLNDCGLTAGEVLTLAGRGDPFARWRGRYTTMAAFLRRVREDGGQSLEDAVAMSAADMGWPEIPIDEAEDFDLGFATYPTGEGSTGAPGVLYRGLWLVRSDVGAVHLPADEAKRVWRTCPNS